MHKLDCVLFLCVWVYIAQIAFCTPSAKYPTKLPAGAFSTPIGNYEDKPNKPASVKPVSLQINYFLGRDKTPQTISAVGKQYYSFHAIVRIGDFKYHIQTDESHPLYPEYWIEAIYAPSTSLEKAAVPGTLLISEQNVMKKWYIGQTDMRNEDIWIKIDHFFRSYDQFLFNCNDFALGLLYSLTFKGQPILTPSSAVDTLVRGIAIEAYGFGYYSEHINPKAVDRQEDRSDVINLRYRPFIKFIMKYGERMNEQSFARIPPPEASKWQVMAFIDLPWHDPQSHADFLAKLFSQVPTGGTIQPSGSCLGRWLCL